MTPYRALAPVKDRTARVAGVHRAAGRQELARCPQAWRCPTASAKCSEICRAATPMPGIGHSAAARPTPGPGGPAQGVRRRPAAPAHHDLRQLDTPRALSASNTSRGVGADQYLERGLCPRHGLLVAGAPPRGRGGFRLGLTGRAPRSGRRDSAWRTGKAPRPAFQRAARCPAARRRYGAGTGIGHAGGHRQRPPCRAASLARRLARPPRGCAQLAPQVESTKPPARPVAVDYRIGAGWSMYSELRPRVASAPAFSCGSSVGRRRW